MLFYLENGLTLTQATLIVAISSITMIILEVPSGIFADLYTRKLALILGAFFFVLGATIRSFSYSFIHFSLAMITLSVGAAFVSGADTALMYDSLKEAKREKEFKKIIGTARSFALVGMGVASILGGFLAKYGLRTVNYAAIAPLILMLFISFGFKEPKGFKKIIKKNYFIHLKESMLFSISHKKVRNLILFSSFIMSMMIASHQFFQPYMSQIGIVLGNFGIFYFIFLMISALSAKYAYKIEEKFGEKSSFIFMPVIFALSLFLMAKYEFYLAFLFIFLGQFVWGFSTPLIQHYINSHIDSDKRATVLSINSLSSKIFLAILSPLVGYTADLWSIQTAFLLQAIVTILVSIFILIGWRLKKN